MPAFLPRTRICPFAPLLRTLAAVLAGLPAAVGGLEVPVAPAVVVVDGILREWGGAGTVALDPGGRDIGLRGVFRDADDHQADVFVMWDARHLYVAAAVRDDSLDARRVPPREREWISGRVRKDRMFYYDHLKVFVRGPGADVGTNLWVAPVTEAGRAYAWGGRQRQEPGDDVPVRAASAACWPVYTYEVALPWSWLGIHPEPDMVLDGLLLLTDSDRPRAEVWAKVAGGDGKWIWWQGRLELRGRPPGWQPSPEVEEQLEAELAPEGWEAQGERIQEAIERVRALRLAEARAESARQAAAEDSCDGPPAAALGTSPQAAARAPEDTAAVAAARRYAAAMRAVLTRVAQGPPEVILPVWTRGVEADSTLTPAQVDSYVVILTRTLSRLVRERTNGRIDYFVIDMASGAGTRRGQARGFLTSLISGYLDELEEPGSGESQRLAGAAQAAGVPVEGAHALVREVARRAQSVYGGGKVTTTDELIRQGRRRADLSSGQAEALLDALFGGR